MNVIRKDVAEANEISRFMGKDITFTDNYVSKFDDNGITGKASSNIEEEVQDEVQVKVENFDTGAINIWSADKFQDKLMMMRDALQTFEENGFVDPG